MWSRVPRKLVCLSEAIVVEVESLFLPLNVLEEAMEEHLPCYHHSECSPFYLESFLLDRRRHRLNHLDLGWKESYK